MQPNVNATLLEVRKAYRLLFEYQTRILDLMRFISGSFNFDYKGGYPKFSNSGPNNGKGKLTCSAWDWLNMYCYTFKFETKKEKQGEINFSIFLVNDTGYYEKVKENEEKNEKKISKTKVSAFENSESSETKLIFVVGKNSWEGWGKNWDKNELYLNEEGQFKSVKGITVFKSYSLEDFFDEDSAIERLRDFEEYCGIHGVDFKYKEKTIK